MCASFVVAIDTTQPKSQYLLDWCSWWWWHYCTAHTAHSTTSVARHCHLPCWKGVSRWTSLLIGQWDDKGESLPATHFLVKRWKEPIMHAMEADTEYIKMFGGTAMCFDYELWSSHLWHFPSQTLYILFIFELLVYSLLVLYKFVWEQPTLRVWHSS